MLRHRRYSKDCSSTLLIVVSLLLSASTRADDFGFEVSASFDADRLSWASPLFSFSGQESTVFSDTDTDTTALTAAWYFGGASDDDGPLSRAVFLSRASSIDFAYRRIDVSANARIDPPPQLTPFPGPISPGLPEDPIFVASPGPATPSVDGNDYALGGRYVWAESGWFVFGGVTIGDGDVSDSLFRISVDSRQLLAGGGLYLGERTAIEIAVIDSEVELQSNARVDDDSATDFAISFTHIGSLGSTWQYGVDAALIERDRANSDTATALRGSLFPSRNVAFGLEIETEVDAVFETGTRYSLFGSWFVTRQLEFFGSYGTVDIDAPEGSTADLDVYSLGFLGRF